MDAQYYVGCAHVEILNPSADVGTPGPLVKIPGVYERGQPGMYTYLLWRVLPGVFWQGYSADLGFRVDVYFSSYDVVMKYNYDVSKWTPPKPEVWTA